MKRSKIISNQPKSIENWNIVDFKYIAIEHPKTSPKLSKTVRQAKKISSGKNSPSILNSETTECEYFFWLKTKEMTKRSHAYKGSASTYDVEILNCFSLELHPEAMNLQ